MKISEARYKQLMESVGMPNSRSLLSALEQVENEVSQEYSKYLIQIQGIQHAINKCDKRLSKINEDDEDSDDMELSALFRCVKRIKEILE